MFIPLCLHHHKVKRHAKGRAAARGCTERSTTITWDLADLEMPRARARSASVSSAACDEVASATDGGSSADRSRPRRPTISWRVLRCTTRTGTGRPSPPRTHRPRLGRPPVRAALVVREHDAHPSLHAHFPAQISRPPPTSGCTRST